jgi:homoserine dehydrogenase
MAGTTVAAPRRRGGAAPARPARRYRSPAVPESSPTIDIGLLGYGTVGGSVDQTLIARAPDLRRVAGAEVRITRALVRDLARPRPDGRPEILTTSFEEIRDDPAIRVVAEVMGGIDPARRYLRELFAAGKSVVSANKQLLARHGEELFSAAEAAGVQLRFEASVCAAIPVVKVLRESMIASDISRVSGIVNGTTNFILTAMSAGRSYEDALAEAQRLGYAEADPTEDVNGADAAAKVAILASIAFHTRVTIDEVPYEGIDTLDLVDVELAEELGFRVRLVGVAERLAHGISARVSPALLPASHPLARIDGSTNAVVIRGSAIREITLVGPGAGGVETASAVIADLMSILGTTGTGFFQHDGYFRGLPIIATGELESRLYLRLEVADQPGVLSSIARLLADEGVSIETVVQRTRAEAGARVVILTHPAREASALAAVERIARLEIALEPPRILRIVSA